ncbi:septum site-determining protein MinC [Thermocrinis minervae]|uniref:Probable septum site-determining protein MinC n=1 Tax=Thermocrinis minervae TaxID=381751 RepID=A0A1M6SUV0_9AQUI|nr:septum site-determining protein MinC [Thermocrinis minervae]SHK48456.1 septum site-determining protein MinC [Thermocrinis minervae]
MIEIKGLTLPVVVVRIKSQSDKQQLEKEIERILSSKLFEGSYFLIEDEEGLDPELKRRVEERLQSKKVRSIKELKERDSAGRLLIVHRHIRSGQRVEHNGDVLILGDVNRDAEVVATGNIIVIGRLSGIAFAGALGDESAVIVATRMEPQSLRIGRKVAIVGDEERQSPGYPEMARVEDGIIVLERV